MMGFFGTLHDFIYKKIENRTIALPIAVNQYGP